MKRCFTSGISGASSAAFSPRSVEVTNSFAPQSLTMYSTSAAVSRELMAV